MRQRTGSIIERKRKVKDKQTGEVKERVSIYGRVTFTSPDGKRHARWRAAANRTDARDKIKELIADLDNHGVEAVLNQCRTFRELCDWYEPKYVRAAVYVGGRKVAGLRSTSGLPAQFEMLRNYFGARELRTITYGDLEEFKLRRLATPVTFKDRHGRMITDAKGQPKTRPRSLSTVHHELALLRHLLRVAEREGWLVRNPFTRGAPLISKADETPRTRVLSLAEEAALLAACTGARAHLRAILICALDTGMRRGEILKLKWCDVDFEREVIDIQQQNTKTLRARRVRLTPRLKAELQARQAKYLSTPDARVFGIMNNVRGAFVGACAEAEITGLRFHDLRHTAATRMAEGGLSDALIARVLGHSQVRQTFTYINMTDTTLDAAAEALTRYQERADDEDVPPVTELIN
jgi:integrase